MDSKSKSEYNFALRFEFESVKKKSQRPIFLVVRDLFSYCLSLGRQLPPTCSRNNTEKQHLKTKQNKERKKKQTERSRMMVVKKKRAEEEGIGTPPGRWSCLGSATVRQVWASNLMEMLPVLQGRGESSFVAVDTGFRGFIHHTLRSAGPQERYFDVKRNVDNLELVNVGLTFFSGGGGGARSSWHINLKDDFKDIRLLPPQSSSCHGHV